MGEAYIISQTCFNILTCTPLGSSKMVKKDQKGKPKRGLSAYFCFMREERPKVMKAKPNLKIGDVTKILAAKWNKLDYEEKKKFVKNRKRIRKDTFAKWRIGKQNKLLQPRLLRRKGRRMNQMKRMMNELFTTFRQQT